MSLRLISHLFAMHEVLIGESCFTTSEEQKLLQRINEQGSTKVIKLAGQWQYYVDLKGTNDLERVRRAASAQRAACYPIIDWKRQLGFTSCCRNISHGARRRLSIAQVCGLDDVHRIERGRVVYLEFEVGVLTAEKRTCFPSAMSSMTV